MAREEHDRDNEVLLLVPPPPGPPLPPPSDPPMSGDHKLEEAWHRLSEAQLGTISTLGNLVCMRNGDTNSVPAFIHNNIEQFISNFERWSTPYKVLNIVLRR